MNVAALAVACTVGLGAAACQPGAPARLPDPGPAPATRPAGPGPATASPAPAGDRPAVPDVDPGRTVSPVQGRVRLVVRGAGPAGGPARAAYLAYLGWVRAYLAAFARPGRDDGHLDRYATAAAAGVVRQRAGALAVRGWAEYGTAVAVSVLPHPAGSTATVTACLDLSGLATRDAGGGLAGREGPVRSVATLTAAGPRWLVARDEKTAVRRCG
jgi:hypothetical protein